MMDLEPGWILRLGDAGALLALLVLGHAMADFVVQTDKLVDRKRSRRGLADHGFQVALVHVLIVAPFATLGTVVAILVLALGHVIIDQAKIVAEPNVRWKATVFIVDQAAHVTLLVATWWVVVAFDWWLPRSLPVPSASVTGAAVLATLYAVAWNGGAGIVRELLRSRGGAEVDTPNRMGKLIGCLERWIVVTLVLLSQWAAIAFVFAAKSIARIKQIEDREFAEYYLVGTLASFVVGTAIGLAGIWALGLPVR